MSGQSKSFCQHSQKPPWRTGRFARRPQTCRGHGTNLKRALARQRKEYKMNADGVNQQSDCRKLLSPARILSLAGQEIAIGLIRLESPGVLGLFSPDSLTPALRLLHTQAAQTVLAETGSHRIELTCFERCPKEFPPKPHYHFHNTQPSK